MRLLFFLCLGIIACRKAEPLDPYFEAYVNGKRFVPKPGCVVCINSRLLGDSVFVLGGDYGPENMGFYVHDVPVKAKTYYFGDPLPLNPKARYNSLNPQVEYRTRPGKKGSLTITDIDKTTQKIKGTFEFVAYNKEGTDSVNVTRGKFMAKYTTY